MKIAVCVKQVPEAGSARRIDPQTKRLDRSGEAALNAFDVNAVEEALRLKEAQGDAEVVVVSMGPAGALDALRKALAMGADRAVLLSDDSAAGSDLLGTSRVLAGEFDLIDASARVGDCPGGLCHDLVRGQPQLLLHVDRARRQKDVDPRAMCVPQSVRACVEVLTPGSAE